MEINPNSQQSTDSSSPTSALGNVQRPGEYLRQIRIAQKRELKDVASDLKMPEKTLTALEQDDYKNLPEPAFIKGYYRSYAKYLKTDATALIQRFDEIYANDTGYLPNLALTNSPIKMMGKLPGSRSERNKKLVKRGLLIIVILLVIGVVITTLRSWSSKKTESAAPQNSNVEVLPLNNSASSAGDELALNFTRPTTVNIVDASGKVLASGRQSSALTVHGQSPFQIRLDDATAVSLSLNQESISLSPYTVNGKADFRLSR